MVKCKDCKQEMDRDKPTASDSCTFQGIEINGEIRLRNTEYFDINNHCHDCGILNKKGNIHHFGCDIERCPKCGNQLISCNCKKGYAWRKRPMMDAVYSGEQIKNASVKFFKRSKEDGWTRKCQPKR
jgi:hypothetical protein